LAQLVKYGSDGSAYASIQGTRPQTLGYGLADSPVGQAMWIYEKFQAWSDNKGDPGEAISVDRMLDDITLYWLTDTAASSARLYYESFARDFARSSTGRRLRKAVTSPRSSNPSCSLTNCASASRKCVDSETR
jgi:epoxide hydrolase